MDCLDPVFSTVTNYILRPTFSVLSPMISAQYHLSHTDLAKILSSFQFSYAVTWLLGGIFLHAVGTRLGLALAVVFWSVVNILTGFASSVFGFAAFRFLLGIGDCREGVTTIELVPLRFCLSVSLSNVNFMRRSAAWRAAIK